jgi:hypothetical protein
MVAVLHCNINDTLYIYAPVCMYMAERKEGRYLCSGGGVMVANTVADPCKHIFPERPYLFRNWVFLRRDSFCPWLSHCGSDRPDVRL